MKTNSTIGLLTGLIILFVITICSCSKNNAGIPEVITTEITLITDNSCICGGEVTSDGGSPVTAKGICWSTNESPSVTDNFTTEVTGKVVFSSELTGLSLSVTDNRPYYLRAYATNDVGTGYGETIIVTPGTVLDIEKNLYHSIIIGSQIWMVENLKVSKFINGDEIPTTTNILSLIDENPCIYQWSYDNNSGFIKDYGLLYTWHTVTDYRGLCPAGWHVPSDSEWHQLALCLDPAAVLSYYESSIAGGKLKETGTKHWDSPNTGADNITGFTALPGGYRVISSFYDYKTSARYWSTTEEFNNRAWHRLLRYDQPVLSRDPHYKSCGLSVRCLKDN
jgi:uncharacterized protein (TIGR02145 family)